MALSRWLEHERELSTDSKFPDRLGRNDLVDGFIIHHPVDEGFPDELIVGRFAVLTLMLPKNDWNAQSVQDTNDVARLGPFGRKVEVFLLGGLEEFRVRYDALHSFQELDHDRRGSLVFDEGVGVDATGRRHPSKASQTGPMIPAG